MATLRTLRNKHFPHRKFWPRIKNQPSWMNPSIGKKMCERDNALTILQNHPTDLDSRKRYRLLVLKVDQMIGLAKQEVLLKRRSTPKSPWDESHSMLGTTDRILEPKVLVDGWPLTDTDATAALNNHFVTAAVSLNHKLVILYQENRTHHMSPLRLNMLTAAEVQWELHKSQLERWNSSQISEKFAEHLSISIVNMFNSCIVQGDFKISRGIWNGTDSSQFQKFRNRKNLVTGDWYRSCLFLSKLSKCSYITNSRHIAPSIIWAAKSNLDFKKVTAANPV